MSKTKKNVNKGKTGVDKKHATIETKINEMDIMNDLFEETMALAIEDNATSDSAAFTNYVKEMLPPEVLSAICEIAGDNEAKFLEEIFEERFSKVEEVEKEGDDLEEQFDSYECSLCERVMRTTRHHLYPRETHDWMLKKGLQQAVLQSTIPLCRMCHSAIHRFVSACFDCNDIHIH
jgi:hypothetical protein